MQSVDAAVAGQEISSVTFVWMQGEKDAQNGNTHYADDLRMLLDKVAAEYECPFFAVIGRITNWKDGESSWYRIRADQELVAAERGHALVDTDRLNGFLEGVHFFGNYDRLGEMFANDAVAQITQ